MTNTQTINGVQITQAQLAQLQAQGVNISQLNGLSSAQMSALLSGNSVNINQLNSFGLLTAQNNVLSQMLSGNTQLVGSLPNMNTLANPSMSAAQAIAMFEQLSGGYLTSSGLNLSGIMSQTGGGGYNFGAVNYMSLSPNDRKFMQNMSLAAMGLQALGSLFGSSSANSSNPMAAKAFGMATNMLTSSERGNNDIVVDADNGIQHVDTGLSTGIDNAIKSIKSGGKVTADIQTQLTSAKTSLGILDSQISTLEGEVAKLEKQEAQARNSVNQVNAEEQKINDKSKQQKIEQYQNIEAQYADKQATADKLKNDYEMTPETITDENGKTVKNPQKEAVKNQYEQAQKEAEQLKAQKDKLKQEIDKDPQMKSVADKTDSICEFYSNYKIKKADLANKKEFRKNLATKIDELEKLTTQKSGGTSTD